MDHKIYKGKNGVEKEGKGYRGKWGGMGKSIGKKIWLRGRWMLILINSNIIWEKIILKDNVKIYRKK